MKRKGKYLSNGRFIWAVDLDGTLLVDGIWPEVVPLPDIVKRLRKLEDRRLEGDKVIVWTCRNGEPLDRALRFLEDHYNVVFDAVNENLPEIIARFRGKDTRKITADFYIDEASGGFGAIDTFLKGE